MAIVLLPDQGTNEDDTLISTGAGDVMVGLAGDDIYLVDDTLDRVVENAGQGTDVVKSTVSFNLSTMANVETLLLLGAGNLDGTGNASNNLIVGNSGNNTLDGGAGDDQLAGSTGDDFYIVDSLLDLIVENPGQGTDTISANLDYDLSTAFGEIENLILTGAAIIGIGSDADNAITGNANVNTLDGGLGDDTIDGGAGADSMIGGDGDDTFYADNAGDLIFENALEGTDTVISTVTYTLSPTEEIENLTLTGAGTIDGTGNGLDNVITGNDQINVLDGGAGNDTLDGGLGADTMIGGAGNDTFFVQDPADVVTEAAGPDVDTIVSTASFNLATNATNVENLTLSGSAVAGTGDGGVNVITGTAGNNTLDGGGGDDTLIGLDGNDVFIVDSLGDTVLENSGEGTDTIRSSVDFDLSFGGQNVENLTLLGAALVGTGDTGNNVITGNANVNTLSGGGGNDTLDGDGDTLSSGADTMIGGLGNDVFIVDNAGDSITEAGSGGTDTVQTEVTYTLTAGAEVETITITGLGAIDVTGNATGQFIGGNDSVNTLDGGLGNDTLDGGLGNDRMIGGDGDDTFFIDSSSDVLVELAGEGVDLAVASVNFDLNANGGEVDNLLLTGTALIGTGNGIDNIIFGNTLNNTLSGGAGNDTLDGGAGNDSMIGGAGDDTFYVGSTGDVVVESAGQGTDTVISDVNYSLSSRPDLENLVLTGAAIIGTGNSSANTITGNANNNILIGADGNDSLFGDLGIDTLNGGAGNDTLDGGLDADILIGGAGDDVFTVDDSGDLVTETTSGSAGGADTVLSSITYILGTNLENLTLDALAGNINGTGNAVVNIITGNAGDNTLNGAAGADSLIGGGGNDTFIVDNILDSVTGGAGIDTIVSSLSYSLNTIPLGNIENLTLTGSAVSGTGNGLDNVITGNAATNILTGLAGNDTLDGGLGNDSLIGGLGDDTLVVNAQTDILIEQVGQGTDTVLSSVTYILSAANVENLTLSGSANINATGSSGDNIVTGNSGNNILNGGLGFDSLEGGLGNDTFIIDTLTDIITDAGGIDTISEGFVDFDLNSVTGVIENLILTGTGNWDGTGDANNNAITGNAGINTLTGNDGNDTLNGGAGGDTMYGGLGDDTFYVDSLLDVIIENPGEGTDTVILVGNLGTYVIPAEVEGLSIIGSSGGNLTGSPGNDILTGNAGNNSLNGLAGADTMIGGKGNDIYFADDAGDFIIENLGEGTDTLFAASSATFTSFDMSTNAINVERLTVTGTGDFDVMGNYDDNLLIGNSGSNLLNGFLGKDSMIGGLGNDFYVVDTTTDYVSDSGGIDTVISTISYTLKSGFENLILTDANFPTPTESGDLIGKGNGANNVIDATLATGNHTLYGFGARDTIYGGDGDDTLDGGTGADTMAGGDGDDSYIVDGIGDIIIENTDEGEDTLTVAASYTLSSTAEVEIINLTGAGGQSFTASDTANEITANGTTKIIFALGGDDTITGGAGADVINGGDGDDYIVSGAGKDAMTGGAGQDTFVLEFASAFLNVDVIRDFNPNDAGSLTDPALGDVLDISDILDHITGSGALSDYVHIADGVTNTIVQIDLDGTGSTYHFRTIAFLENIIGLTGEANLLLSGNLEDGGLFT
ncbi:MAG: calcium-binding protein [Alphaproteobacteria bacterium]|nr:MAG: calcium-binding protein [Alphaproteobacteria bacterium]